MLRKAQRPVSPRTAPSEDQARFQIRFSTEKADIDQAQALRYRVFYEDAGVTPERAVAESRRDADDFDAICDHLLVLDTERDANDQVVGAYRLLRRSVARRHDGFYTAGEFDIASLANFPGELLELGRSCVDPGYRSRAIMQLLWGGIAQYVFQHDIELMFGCASFPGASPDQHAGALAWLYENHLAPEEWRPRALEHLYVPMAPKPGAERLGDRAALLALPPLIKGYLRLGGVVGDGAVLDTELNTTDISLLVKTDRVSSRYYKHYESARGSHN